MPDEKLERLAKLYLKLRRFLFAVPMYQNVKHGPLPTDGILLDNHFNLLRLTDENRPYRLASETAIMFGQYLKDRFPHPTFDQFVEAYGG